MQKPQLLETIVKFLEENYIPYMVTGSVASSLQGQPRSTHDADIVVIINTSTIDLLLNSFTPPQYYVSKDAILDAIKHKSMFNLIDTSGGDKIDFWMLTDEDFDTARFARKYQELIQDFKMNVSSPEDTILSKLKWAKLSGGSEKQFIDALRVYELQYINLDKNYLEDWAKKLQVVDLLDKIKEQANPFE